MELDVIKIGERIRKIREEDFKETREVFAERCNITVNHLGKLERGGFLISTKLLNTISSIAGVSTDYILYGKTNGKDTATRNRIDYILDNASIGELKAFLRVLSAIKENYDIKNKKNIG